MDKLILHSNVKIKDKPLFKIFMKKVKDGFIFGIGEKNIGDVHLTILFTNGRFGYHISDKNIEIQNPRDSHFTPNIFFDKLQKKLKKIIKKYHGNKKVYVMKGRLKKEFNSIIKKYLKDDEIHLELYLIRIECDFENNKRWEKKRIKDIVNEKYPFGFIEEKHIIKYAIPLNNKIMLLYSEWQYNNLINLFFRFFGFDDYIDYLKEQKKFKIDMRNI